jgi:WD40 repeat protein
VHLDLLTGRGNVSAAFSPDNARLVTVVSTLSPTDPARNVFTVTGWEVKTGKKLGEFSAPVYLQLTDLAAANNNSGAVLATLDGRLWVADYEKGLRAETLEEASPGTQIRCPTFSPDGKLFAVGVPTANSIEHSVRIYSWPRGKALHTFTGHRSLVSVLAFSPDGKTLASGSQDTTILVWDLTVIPKP